MTKIPERAAAPPTIGAGATSPFLPCSSAALVKSPNPSKPSLISEVSSLNSPSIAAFFAALDPLTALPNGSLPTGGGSRQKP
ncbi:MAG: hypothetical protein MK172_06080 [Verrucomicrobiales bacterium]|nr:hypothetical protein [Verrucomicrobiales bacterium]